MQSKTWKIDKGLRETHIILRIRLILIGLCCYRGCLKVESEVRPQSEGFVRHVAIHQ